MTETRAERRARIARRLAEVDRAEVTIEKLVTGGDGLGRFEGIPFFVPRSVPGDRLLVDVVERRAGHARAEIVEVLAPGPSRREPPCPHFARCGGCDLQQIDDDAQTRFKVEAAVETLARIGGLRAPGIEIEVARGAMWGYRSRCQVRTEPVGDKNRVGYFARASHDLVPIETCPILAPELERFVVELPRSLPEGSPRRLDCLLGDRGKLSASPLVEGLPHGPVEVTVGGHVLELDSTCFFQAHRELVEDLVERAVGAWGGGTAVDLYAGVGLFSLPLAARYERVVAVEGDRTSVRYARRNARRNQREVEVVNQAVESWVAELPDGLDRVVVDPPRSGLTTPVRQALVRARPGRLTYVSCDPATLARDLKMMGDAFRVESLTFLDLFPQTAHVETIAQLVSGDEA